MKQFIIKKNLDGYRQCADYIDYLARQGTITVTVKKGEDKQRSLSANALQAAWINEISEFTGDTKDQVRKYIKREIGLPIIRYSPDFVALDYTLTKVNYDMMSPAQKDAVLNFINVTSVMNTKDHSKLMTDIQNHYRDTLGLELVVR
jgi:hypothetical protein